MKHKDSAGRLVYIEPNEYAGLQARRLNNELTNSTVLSWNPEDMAISVDLQVIIPRREDAGQTSYLVKVDGSNITMNNGLYGRYVSYMEGIKYNNQENTQSYLTDNYTNISYQEVANGKVVDKESLGINSIDINFDAHFFPLVTIKFTDVRGASLFMPSEQEFDNSLKKDKDIQDTCSSFFKALFHFPYPRFLLTVKGFYGTKVTFQLAVSDFTGGLSPDTGNYDMTVKFIGYVYGLYTDLPLNLVMSSPYYNSKYWQKKIDDGTFRYVSKGGTSGNPMLTYPEFLYKAQSKELESSQLKDATLTLSYLKTKEAIKYLAEIPKLYKNLVKSAVPKGLEQFYGKTSGNDATFVWGVISYTTDENDNITEENAGFMFDIDASLALYKAIQEVFKNFPEYTSLVEDGNHFLTSFYNKKINGKEKLTCQDIIDDRTFKYKDLFARCGKTKRLTEYFDFYDKDAVIENTNKKAEGWYTIKGYKELFSKIEDNDLKSKDIFSINSNLDNGGKISKLNDLTVNKDRKYGVCIVFDVTAYCKHIDDEITRLEEKLRENENNILDEIKSVYENVIGFEPTVENYYRMLFAHIDCFFNFYTGTVLKQVYDQYNNGERTLKALNIDVSDTDLPKRFATSSDNGKSEVSVYPWPAYYSKYNNKKNVRIANYPGYASGSKSKFASIPEVKAVETILSGVEKFKLEMDNSSFPSNKVNVNNIFSRLSILYGFDNPWNTLKLDSTNIEDDIWHIVYFYMCLTWAESAVGGLTIKTLQNYPKDENGDTLTFSQVLGNLLYELINNQVDTKLFVGGLRKVIDTIDGWVASDITGLLNDKYEKTYCLYTALAYNSGIDKKVIRPHYEYSCYRIALKVTDNILGVPITFLPHTISNNYSVGGDNYVTGGAQNTSCEHCATDCTSSTNYVTFLGNNKPLNEYKKTDLKVFFQYLQKSDVGGYTINGTFDNPDRVSLGDMSVNLLYDDKHANDPYIGINKNRNIFKYNTYSTNISLINSALNDYYKNDNMSGYHMKFVGLKSVVWYGSAIEYDGKPSVNLFSGIKEMYDTKSSKLKLVAKYKNGEEIEYFDNSYKKNDNKYKGLLYTAYCVGEDLPKFSTLDDAHKEKARYAFATYFLATLCGTGTLKQSINAIIRPNESKINVFRKVELLYLGGCLYFASNGYNYWSKNGKHIVCELLNEHGHVLGGLIDNDGMGKLNKNEQIDVDEVLNSKIQLIEYFTDWCDNELFGTNNMFDMLSYVSSTEDDNYMNLCMYLPLNDDGNKINGDSFKEAYKRCIVQGYKPGGECDNWLTKLVLDYEFLVSYHVDEDKELQNTCVTRDGIIKFLKQLLLNFENKQKELDEKQEKLDNGDESVISEDEKRALYYTLKNLYDKWLCTYRAEDFELNTVEEDHSIREARFAKLDMKKASNMKQSEYNNFIYIDQFYNDISSTFIMNTDLIVKTINDEINGNINMDVYNFMSFLAEKNNLMLLSLPVYTNMYKPSDVERIFTPNTSYNMNSNDNCNGVGTTYVLMYTSEVSHKPGDFSQYDYDTDYIDIAGILDDKSSVDLFEFSNNSENDSSDLNYTVTAFGVTYSKQNQTYFKKVNVNMDNPKITDESIRNVLMLSDAGSQGDTNQPISVGQNVYSIYSNRSYTCTVEMMGCANIMPLMYFQLNSIPMFRGLYMIINVNHNIQAGNMTTVFTGVRVNKYSLPDVSSVLLNSSIFDRIEKSRAWKEGKAISGGNEVCLNLTSGINRTRDIEYIKKSLKKALNVTDEEFNLLGFTNNDINSTSGVIRKIKLLIKDGRIELKPVEGFPVASNLTNKILPGLANDLTEIYEEIKALGDDYAKCQLTSIYRPSSENSSHSAGLAVDIGNGGKNPFANNCYNSGVDSPLAYRTWEHPVVKIFMNHGWGWGIFFDGRRDYMHFSYNIDNAGDKDSNGNIKRCGH